jgi:hypothetical protein
MCCQTGGSDLTDEARPVSAGKKAGLKDGDRDVTGDASVTLK